MNNSCCFMHNVCSVTGKRTFNDVFDDDDITTQPLIKKQRRKIIFTNDGVSNEMNHINKHSHQFCKQPAKFNLTRK